MPFAPVNGQRLFFEDGGGDKPVVVFSHGNLMNRWMWAPQIETLRTQFRCLVWDQRLHGHTEDDHGLHTFWDSASDLLGLMDHLDIDRAALVGHSQGGFLSLRAALLAPDRVTALVLLDTAGVAWPPEALAQMRGISDGFRTDGPDSVGAGLLGMLLGEPDIHDDWLRSWHQQPNDRLADAVTVLMGVDDIAARLSEVTQPALILHGEADEPVPLQFGQLLREALPQAVDLVVVPGAGHSPSLTHADQVNPALIAFLRQYA